jgi:predicted PolB exonuclease-like 3'-5' exonuclease
MMVRGMHPLFKHGTKPWDMQVNDTMLMFAAGTKNYYKLEQLCLAFGVNSPKDGGVDGSQIYEYYQAGKHDEIRAYCARDVEATRAVYNRMMVQ